MKKNANHLATTTGVFNVVSREVITGIFTRQGSEKCVKEGNPKFI
jgi:hypothetical protein